MRSVPRLVALIGALALSLPAFPGPGFAAEERVVPRRDRTALEKTLRDVFETLPAPRKSYRRDREADDREVAARTPPRTEDGSWRFPAGARATRSYARSFRSGETLELEITVYLNLESSLSDPLGSAGGSLRVEMRDKAPVVRHSLAGIDESRLEMPLTAEQTSNALTVVRAYIAVPEATDYLIDLAQGRRPSENPWQGATVKRPSDVRTIVVEYHGPAVEVDRLSDSTHVAELRALLTP